MTALSTPLQPTDRTPTATLYRRAGLGGLVVFGGWLAQPILVFALLGDEELLTYDALRGAGWVGPFDLVAFCLIATGWLVLVDNVHALLDARQDGRRPLGAVPRALGLAGGLAWLLLAAMTTAPFTTASSDLAELGRDDQVAALSAHGIGDLGVLIFSVLCLAAWMVLVAPEADRRGVLPRPVTVTVVLLAVVGVAPLLIPFSAPWGTVALVLAAAVLGVTGLVRSRSAA
ncbi:MAG TPA: hypothetical protein VIT20_03240 [Propionibacteriaceae bacterium]